MKKYTVTLTLLVDPDASFLSADMQNHAVDVEEAIRDLLVDLDDTKVVSIEASRPSWR